VEFDYCCVRAGLAFRELGFKTVMINSNPETVSTTSTFPTSVLRALTLEDVLEIVRWERPKASWSSSGGQTPLRLTKPLEAAGPILGTRPIDRHRGGRGRFEALADRLGVTSRRTHGALRRGGVKVAERLASVLVRPSYVLGGRPWRSWYDEGSLRDYFEKAARVAPEHPVLIDRFLEDAFEGDVDAWPTERGASSLA